MIGWFAALDHVWQLITIAMPIGPTRCRASAKGGIWSWTSYRAAAIGAEPRTLASTSKVHLGRGWTAFDPGTDRRSEVDTALSPLTRFTRALDVVLGKTLEKGARVARRPITANFGCADTA